MVHLSISSPKVKIWLFNKLQRIVDLISYIKIVWISGHCIVPLNEKADRLAKSVLELDTFIDRISLGDIIAHNRKGINLNRERQYQNNKYRTSYGNLPSIKT